MLYALEQGPTERRVIEAAIRERRPLPKRIQDAPTLFVGLERAYSAFIDIGTCRPLGFGAEGPLPWWCIELYARSNGYTRDEQQELEFLLREMDNAYLSYRAKKLEAGKK